MNSSPIETWEGASAIFSFANSLGSDIFFWLSVLLCILPLVFTMKTENHHENKFK